MLRTTLVFSWLALGVMTSAPRSLAQPTAAKTLRLSSDSATNSQLAAIRGDLIAAITQGASPSETSALIQRHRQVDQSLQVELAVIRDELVKIKNSDFNRDSQHRRAELRRQESLLWLTRVELTSLLPEMFADGTADCVALSNRAVGMITEALAKFPNDSELHGELARLMSQAQLRSGNPDAAIRTMQQASADEGRDTDKSNAQTSESPLVIKTSDELAFVIRVDLAKHRWGTAAAKLQQYFGDQPDAAPLSPSMDLARLRYLLMRPDHSSDFSEVGEWLDAIQIRSGAAARRNAETLLARYRTPDSVPPSVASNRSDSSESSIDPRVIRADARYYLRVGQTLPAAITFARAAVQDSDATRGVESAIQSAAILQSVSKGSAAAELLRRIAVTHRDHPSAPMLMLQAASLRSEANEDASAGSNPSNHDLLVELLDDWPTTDAAQTARSTLIDSAIASGDHVAAAVLATEMPAEHWNESTASRCRQLWERAIADTDPLRSPCHWDDENCQRDYAAELADRLATMQRTFAAAASHSLVVTTDSACTILLDSCVEQSRRQELGIAEKNVKDPFLASLARRRLGIDVQEDAPETTVSNDARLSSVVAWRLNQDLLENPVLHREIATYLLKLIDDTKTEIAPRLKISWLMWSGRIDQGDLLLRDELAKSDHPADLIAAAASSLATSTRPAELSRASRLWQQLADGIPSSRPAHQRAKVESISCLWRSGKRSEAQAAAELMLLTNPPEDPILTKRLIEWAS